MNILAAAAYVQPDSTTSRASLKRARGVKAALAWDTKASWLMKRFLDSSTSQPEAFPVTQAHRYKPGQPPWTSQLGVEVLLHQVGDGLQRFLIVGGDGHLGAVACAQRHDHQR